MEIRKKRRGLDGKNEERKRDIWKEGRKEEDSVERLKKGRGLGGKNAERKRAIWKEGRKKES